MLTRDYRVIIVFVKILRTWNGCRSAAAGLVGKQVRHAILHWNSVGTWVGTEVFIKRTVLLHNNDDMFDLLLCLVPAYQMTDPVVFGAGAVVGVGTTAIAVAACWVGGAVVGGIGMRRPGFDALVPMLQASKTKIETIQIAPLNFISALSLLHF